MRVEHFLGVDEVNNENEIKNVLSIRVNDQVNEFWIGMEEEPYPCLCVSVNGEKAHVQYFEEAGEPGIQAIGNDNSGEMCVFYTNTPTEKIEIEKQFVITINQAIDIVEFFYRTKELTNEVQWYEL